MKKVYTIFLTLLLTVAIFSMNTVIKANMVQLQDESIVPTGDTVSDNLLLEDASNITLNTGETITSISLGGTHSSAITSIGRVFAWGNNYYGELGDGTTTNRNVPTEITSHFGLVSGETVTSISLGINHSSAITSKGRIFTWGYNSRGQLGDGTTTYKSIPTEITGNFNLNTGETITEVSLGYWHSSAITSTGRIFTWGYNNFGQLGDGTTINRLTPTEITGNFSLNTGETITEVILGGYHSSVITSERRIFTWGYNGCGELGDGTTTDRYTPIEITGNFSLNIGETITEVSLGYYHSSAITSEGRIFTWGHNYNGQLGDGTTTNRNTPTEITGNFSLNTGETITEVSLGWIYSSAITSEGRIFTWGYNYWGQLGDGTTTDTATPTEITNQFGLASGETITEVILGGYHSSAITSIGRVFAWGSNYHGKLGDGTTTDRYTPIEITGNFSLNIEAPVISLIGDSTVYVEYEGTYTEGGATFTDNYDASGDAIVGGATVDSSVLGTYTVTYNITDTNSNVALEVIRTVIVQDTTVPVISLTGDSVVYVEYNGVYTEEGSTFTDNYDASGDALGGGAIVDSSVLGTYTVKYNITDTNSNIALEVTRTVIVQDTTIPEITLTGDETVYVEYEGTYTEGGATFTDNYDLLGTVIIDSLTVDSSVLGTYTVTYNVTDTNSNVALEVTRTVIVQDTTIPKITLTGDETVYVECEGTYTELGATFIDNYDTTGTVIVDSSTVDSSVLGTYTITYNVTDSEGNIALEVIRTVIVQDTTAPAFEITNQTIEAGEYTTLESLINNIIENSDDILVYSEPGVQMDYDTPGTYTVTVRLSDISGNYSNQEVTIMVQDTTAPTFINTIDDQTVEAGIADMEWERYTGPVKDNSDGYVMFKEEQDNVNYNVPGVYSVIVSVADESGNATNQTFNVIVQDTIAPTALLNPSIDSVEVGTSYTEYGVTAEDVTDTSYIIEGTVDVYTPGVYVLTYHVTDTSGNETTIDRYVKVYGKEPVIEFTLDNAVTTIQVDETYTDGLCTVNINGTDYQCTVKENNVNTSTSGVYTITYSYTFNDKEYIYKRYIFIVDENTPLQLYVLAKKEDGEIL